MGQELDMSPIVNITILIKDPRLFHQARHCAQELIDTGANVLLYYLCTDMPSDDQAAQLQMLRRMTLAAECYMDDPRLADRYGLSCMHIGRLAEKLKDADRVIPF
jgi:hypothetical protein